MKCLWGLEDFRLSLKKFSNSMLYGKLHFSLFRVKSLSLHNCYIKQKRIYFEYNNWNCYITYLFNPVFHSWENPILIRPLFLIQVLADPILPWISYLKMALVLLVSASNCSFRIQERSLFHSFCTTLKKWIEDKTLRKMIRFCLPDVRSDASLPF